MDSSERTELRAEQAEGTQMRADPERTQMRADPERTQMRADQLHLLSQTGPESLMGQLLRRFWQPVARSETVPRGQARPLRVMSEDLTLFRGDSGTLYLVGGRCAHRCTVLHTGWVEGEQIRCMYHGWRYDGHGVCTDIPAEKRPRADPVHIVAYPVREYHGLVFAYLGPAPAPEFDLPRKHAVERPGQYVFNREQVWDCNWFQQVENSLDAVHVSFVHVWGRMSRFGEELSTAIPELSYTETDSGIRQVATRSRYNVRVSDWTFPNNNHVVQPGPRKGDPWIHIHVWAVPIDDHSTLRFNINCFPSVGPEEDARIAEDAEKDFNPMDHFDTVFGEHRIPDVGASQVLMTQDYAAVRGQGRVADRAHEHLSASDAGIVFLRRIVFRELELIRQGLPNKQWTRLAHEAELPRPIPQRA